MKNIRGSYAIKQTKPNHLITQWLCIRIFCLLATEKMILAEIKLSNLLNVQNTGQLKKNAIEEAVILMNIAEF